MASCLRNLRFSVTGVDSPTLRSLRWVAYFLYFSCCHAKRRIVNWKKKTSRRYLKVWKEQKLRCFRCRQAFSFCLGSLLFWGQREARRDSLFFCQVQFRCQRVFVRDSRVKGSWRAGKVRPPITWTLHGQVTGFGRLKTQIVHVGITVSPLATDV